MMPNLTRRQPAGGDLSRTASSRRSASAARVRACLDRLEARTLLSSLAISEFLASNTSTLADSSGQFNDWIEIHNSSTAPASTAGYSLTDEVGRPRKWVFPNVTIPAGGYLLVFASGKNQAVAGQELHTNFSLNGDGEYLALFEPDGTTAATRFAPFPNQHQDISYGFDPASPGGATLRYYATPTPGAANVRSEVVINELHYDPDVKTQLTEFVELHNPGAAAVDLSGAYFSSGIDYTFEDGASLGPGAYLVLAQNAAQFQAKFGRAPFAQYVGALSNDGESVTLRNRTGGQLDTVDYKPGFPWPTVGDAPGYSIELINPDFDNSVGGNWRAHVAAAQQETTLLAAGSTWKYLKGTAEASNPVSDWRQPGFDDAAWSEGGAPIGFDGGGLPMRTLLSDMKGNYTSVFMRTSFDVANPASYTALRLEALADDGFNVWINGTHVASFNVPSDEMAFSDTASVAIEDSNFKPYTLPTGELRAGRNVIAVQFFNANLSVSSDAFFDGRLIATAGGGGANPTPGARNSVYADNAAPQMRHVENTPQQPKSGEPVTITTLVTDPDGVANVTLKYQLVDPGNYISIDDAAYQTNWSSAVMNDSGTNGDAAAGDGVYTVVLPASIQTNRRLVRYRVTATDGRGASITAPYADDSVPNFAYFVYDGIAGWSGSAQPGTKPVVNYSADVMNSVPAYHLISKNADVENATWWSKYGGDNYLWKGTLVYDGVVYDHVSYRARGGVWRYAMVKNMWKFDFNHNHGFQAKDDYGRPYATKWDKLNLGANIQQGDFGQRGEQGLFESVGMKLFNLAGANAPATHYVQFRVIDAGAETGASQFDGDLWGLYLAVEQPDGKFLDQHGLPDGNFYKMDGGTGELNNQGPTQPTNKADLNAFMAGYQNASQTDQWFRDNMNLDAYFSYRTIVEGIHHYDIDESAGKNYFFYHNPDTGKWETTVWDIDLTWADNMYGSGHEPFRDRVLPRAAFNLLYKNRVRELRDLLFNPDQAGQVIDEMAAKVYTPGQPSFVDVDRAMWDYNPRMLSPNGESSAPGKAGQGRFYQAVASHDFAGMAQRMKGYVVTRDAVLDTLARDAAIPNKPTVTYQGAAGYPADGLRFSTSAFTDPQGNNTFAAMEWRIAEVTDPAAPGYDPKAPKKYEINADWESGELTTFSTDVSIPSNVAKPGRTYRVRVRMKDSTGRWSNWSDKLQFVAGAPDASVKDSLRITELHYHPAPNPAGPPAEDEFEFVELQNIGAAAINLQGVHFTRGIIYTFGDSVLEAGQYVVVAVNRDPDAFPARYPDPGINLADGVYTGHLDNTGERVTLLDANDQSILDFTYSDLWYPTTDGEGPSLVVKDPLLDPATWNDAASWRPSFADGGSPGSADAQADTTPPTADMIDVTPNPRRAPVDSITIVFTEPVSGFDLSDVRLSRDGTLGNLLTAAQTLTTADNVTWTVGNLSAITAEPGYYAANLRAASGIVDAAGNALVAAPSAFWTTLPPVWVVGRSVFYNNSSYDGNTPGIDAADAGAIATDKQALIPGRAVSAANYTNYTRGINGLMIDLTGRWTGQPLTADDFAFKVGSTPGGADWIDAPAPSAIDDRPTGLPGNELGGPERVTFVWPDGAIRNAWLQVTVKANDRTALAEPHVFYFGNLAGDTGDGAITAVVNALDLAAVKRALNTPADVTSRLDFDRSGRINALDLAAVKSNLNRSLSLQGAAPARIAAAAAFSIVPITAPSPLAPSRAWDEAPVDPLARA